MKIMLMRLISCSLADGGFAELLSILNIALFCSLYGNIYKSPSIISREHTKHRDNNHTRGRPQDTERIPINVSLLQEISVCF